MEKHDRIYFKPLNCQLFPESIDRHTDSLNQLYSVINIDTKYEVTYVHHIKEGFTYFSINAKLPLYFNDRLLSLNLVDTNKKG